MSDKFKMGRENMEAQRLLAIILISLGIILTLTTLNVIPGSSILFILAIGFLYAYYKFRKNIGFLIPGVLFIAIGVFSILKEIWNIDGLYFLLFLGLAFISIFLIHTSKITTGNVGERYWPLYPGFILTGLSLILIFQQSVAQYLNLIVPLLLILIGVIMMIKGSKK